MQSPLKTLTPSQREQLLKSAKAAGLKRQTTAEAPIERADRTVLLPLSYAQQRLWFLSQLEGVSEAYHIPLGLRLRGDLDQAALRAALDSLVARHEALRTRFVQEAGEPRQRIAPEGIGFALQEHDLRGEADVEGALCQLSAQEVSAQFDLHSGPVIRGRLIRLAEHEHVLLLTMHHIVSDGWSVGVLLQELGELYRAYRCGQTDTLPALPIQYADYAVWQRRWLSGALLQSQREYWQRTLSGAPALLELPSERVRPAQQDYVGALLEFELGEELTGKLKALSQRHTATLFMTVLTGWAVVLSRLSGQQDVVIGTPVANRTRLELEGLIGFFVNTLALRLDLSGNPGVSELLQRVKSQTLNAHQHQDLPFEQVVEIVQPPRSLAHSPLFQVLFVWQNAQAAELEWPGLQLQPAELPHTTTKFDLTLSLVEAGDRIVGGVEYATALYERSTIERYMGYLRRVLEQMCADEQLCIEELQLLGQCEQHQLLVQWNATHRAYPREQCIHELFEEQAARTPEACALVGEREELSYGELNAQANRLARYLRELGVQPDDRVGLCAERGVQMVVGLLGILKAGGAYVPLDASYPVERLTYMLRDSAPRMVLTHGPLSAPVREALGAARLIDLQVDAHRWSQQSARNLDRGALSSAHLAYVIYTSGSTGQPKGVMIEHRNTVNLISWSHASFSARSLSRMLFSTSLSFDLAVYESLVPLTMGARVQIVADALSIARTRGAVSLINTVPSAIRALLDAEQVPDCVEEVNLAGEALKASVVERLFAHTQVRSVCNLYGPSETTTYSTWVRMDRESGFAAHIGRPIDNTRVYVLDGRGEAVPTGVVGEIYIAGEGLSRGYQQRAQLTAERYVPDPFDDEGERMYRTGDLGRYRSDGNLEFLGRNDHQVKIRGYRIELGEIEAHLSEHAGVHEAVVLAREGATHASHGRSREAEPRSDREHAERAQRDVPSEKRLVAYYTSAQTSDAPDAEALREHLLRTLPHYMVPAAYVKLDALPLSANGKINYGALPAPTAERPELSIAFVAPRGEIEKEIAAIWTDVLDVSQVGIQDNFFDLGGHSLLLMQVHSRLAAAFGRKFPLLDLFKHTTVASQARYVMPEDPEAQPRAPISPAPVIASQAESDIAIIGMAGRFPGADDIDRLWANLTQGVESITDLSHDELLVAGIAPELRDDPLYVKRDALSISDLQCFDAQFFGLNPREAEAMDPQQRLFLQAAWHALEDAGCDPLSYTGRIAVYAGQGTSDYLWMHVLPHARQAGALSHFQTLLVNDKDYLATQVAYRLNLKGPALTIQTACSTSLVAVHTACRSLLGNECDVALAGGVSLRLHRTGYLYEPGSILSGDGRCRPFDAAAQGTVTGSGLGIVALKRLRDAITDGDAIHAIIKGSAVTNDGRRKAGYTAPSEDGQVEAIRAALTAAAVSASSIGYIEAHGTGTVLGDAIELAALRRVFDDARTTSSSCGVGSLKGNIGHLDAAAGVAGLIKTVLMLKHAQLVPTLHVSTLSPNIDWAKAPFHINTSLRPWHRLNDQPRRAGVSSFGMGGTNAHVILEETPESRSIPHDRGTQLLVLSAQREDALQIVAAQMASYLRTHRDVDLADVAYTLQVGRHPFAFRCAVTAADSNTAVAALEAEAARPAGVSRPSARHPMPVFMFPGQGSQYIGMGRSLYRRAARFRESLDDCLTLLEPLLGGELRRRIFDDVGRAGVTAETLNQTVWAQPALFCVEYALAQQWIAWGVQPQALIGHSLGEYVAAHLAGVFSLEDVLTLIVKRANLMHSMPAGRMLSIMLPVDRVTSYLGDGVCLAATNAPSLCVLSGEARAMDELERRLSGDQVSYVPLRTSHAFHSHMMEPLVDEFIECVSEIERHPPKIPFISNVTGTWITADQAVDPRYWGAHLRERVRFSEGMQCLLQRNDLVMLETGPGHTLTQLSKLNGSQANVSSLRISGERDSEQKALLHAVGELWCAGVHVNWSKLHEPHCPRRAHLPLYPFAKGWYWMDPAAGSGSENGDTQARAHTHARGPLSTSFAPPETLLERQIAEVWRMVLGLDRIGIDDDFLELGGHSLLGVRVITLLKRSGIAITSVDLFKHPTVRALAAQVSGGSSPVMTGGAIGIRTSGTEPPLFLVHEYYGLDLHFTALAAKIDAAVPVYGLPAIPLEDRQLQTMEGLAARLVGIVRRIQPEGPYRLAGWSFSGALAYEVAGQLIGEDQAVSFVGLIDTYAPAALRGMLSHQRMRDDTPAKRLLSVCQGELTGSTAHEESVARLRAQADSAGLAGTLTQCRQLGLLPQYLEDLSLEEVSRYLERLVAHTRALENYAAHSIAASVHLFAAQDGSLMPNELLDPLRGWRSVLAQSQIVRIEVPGSHNTIMEEPHIAALGQAISNALSTSAAPRFGEEHRAHIVIQDGRKTRPPLICVPGGGDSVVRFNAFAAAIGEDWPVHGMQPRGLDGEQVPHASVQVAAATYLREIDVMSRQGPVHLLGHSFGGWVAFEMAHRMRTSGIAIASLTLVDSEPPSSDSGPGQEYTPWDVLSEYIELVELSEEKSLNLKRRELEAREWQECIELLHARMVAAGIMHKRSTADMLRGPLRTFAAALRTTYVPPMSLDLPLGLVLVTDSRISEQANQEKQRAALEGWKRFAPELRVGHGPGNHMTILKPPHLQSLVQWWTQSLI